MTPEQLKKAFLSGDKRLDTLIFNTTQDTWSEYSPIKPDLFSRDQLRVVIESSPQLAHLKSLWFANVGRNGSTVNVKSILTEASKEKIQRATNTLLYNRLNWDEIQDGLLIRIFEEGNAVLWFNRDNEPVIESIHRFNVYRDDLNKTVRYAYINSKGQEVRELSNLRHGVDLFHFKDPIFKNLYVAPSRINLIYIYLVLLNNGLEANAKLFKTGGIGLTLLGWNEEKGSSNFSRSDLDGKPNKNGMTNLEIRMRKVWDRVSGTKNANKIDTLPGLEKVFELGKDNKSMQFIDLIKDVVPEQIAWAYGLTLADLGSGDNTTYNNTQTFSYVFYYKLGALLERQFDYGRNSYLLPHYGIRTEYKGDYYVSYNKPSNPDSVKNQEQARLDFEAGLITVNEYRDIMDKQPAEGGDVFKTTWDILQSNGLVDTPEVETFKKKSKHYHSRLENQKSIKSLLQM